MYVRTSFFKTVAKNKGLLESRLLQSLTLLSKPALALSNNGNTLFTYFKIFLLVVAPSTFKENKGKVLVWLLNLNREVGSSVHCPVQALGRIKLEYIHVSGADSARFANCNL